MSVSADRMFLQLQDGTMLAMRAEAGVIQVSSNGDDWADIVSGGILGDETVTDTYGVTNDAPAIQAAIDSAIANGDSGIHIPPGTHRLKSTVTIEDASGIVVYGNARTKPTILIDDSDGNIGDGFLIKNTLACETRDFLLKSTSARTAGNGIHVTGGDPAQPLDLQHTHIVNSSTLITDVDMTNMYNGILVDSDEVNNYQNWRTYIKGGFHLTPNPLGIGIWINTSVALNHFGASHFIQDYYFDQQPAATGAGIRLSGTGDITLTNNEIYGAAYALLMDPPASAFLGCVNIIGGFYDTASLACLRIAPNASAQQCGIIKAIGAWFGTSSADAAQIVGAAAAGIHFTNCTFANAQAGWACIVDAATNIDFSQCHFSSATSGGLWLKGNAAQFTVQGSKFMRREHIGALNGLPIGVQIDAGCDHYSVTGNVFDTGIATPITNTPGTSAARRIVQDNVTA